MPKFFVEKQNINDRTVSVTGEDVAHISRVLRMSPGDKITVCDGEGYDCTAVITSITKDAVFADIAEKHRCEAEPGVKITVFQALPKQGKMEYIIQKNTELGVSEFVPVYTKRCVAKPSDKTKRWQRVALEAAKQCGRGCVPKVHDTVNFKDALLSAAEYEKKIILYECEDKTRLSEVIPSGISSAAVFVGPEGGFEPEEIEAAQEHGIIPVTLGKRILRTETAAAAVTPIILFIQGEV